MTDDPSLPMAAAPLPLPARAGDAVLPVRVRAALREQQDSS